MGISAACDGNRHMRVGCGAKLDGRRAGHSKSNCRSLGRLRRPRDDNRRQSFAARSITEEHAKRGKNAGPRGRRYITRCADSVARLDGQGLPMVEGFHYFAAGITARLAKCVSGRAGFVVPDFFQDHTNLIQGCGFGEHEFVQNSKNGAVGPAHIEFFKIGFFSDPIFNLEGLRWVSRQSNPCKL